jgi:hypothetical protein
VSEREREEKRYEVSEIWRKKREREEKRYEVT